MTTITFPRYNSISFTAASTAELRAYPVDDITDGMLAFLGGQTSLGDGIGGIFSWLPASTIADDNEDYIAPKGIATGRWHRIIGRRQEILDQQASNGIGADKLLTGFSSIAEIKALNPAHGDRVTLNAGGKSGIFVFDASNHVSEITSDPLEGVYFAPDSASGGGSGAWVRQWEGQFADPRWFGAVADGVVTTSGDPLYAPLSVSGTDNAAAIQACIDVCGGATLSKGYWAVGAQITLGIGEFLNGHSVANSHLVPLSSFTGSAVVSLEQTRTTCERINVVIPSNLYDHEADTGTRVNGIQTTGYYFHQYIRDCRVRGGYHGFYLTAFEASLLKCNADKNYNGFYITAYQTSPSDLGGYDQSLINCSATDNTNFGVYADRGFEATDLHIVRAGECALKLASQTPVMIAGLFVDTPTRDGIHLIDTKAAHIGGIHFTKGGERRPFDGGATQGTGTTPDHACRYVVLERSRDNYLKGNSIFMDDGNIAQTDIYFVSIDDGSTGITEATRSIRNTFEGFRLQTVPVCKNDVTQKRYATWQHWRGNSGTGSRVNNDGYLYRGGGMALAAGATASVKFFLPEIDQSAGNQFAHMEFTYNTRSSEANRSAGIGIIPLVRSADTGSKDGAFGTPQYAVGTPPTFSITGINVTTVTAGTAKTRYVEYTVTNTSGATATFSHAVRPPMDNQGF